MMELGLLSARFILGCLFLISSLGKFRSFHSFAGEISDYRLLAAQQAQIVAHLLPFLELGLAGLMLLGFGLGPTSILMILLLVIFTGAIAINLLRGRRFGCHCFGRSSAMIGPAMLLRNALLAALAFWIFLQAPTILNVSSLVTLWRSDIQQLAQIDTSVPLTATIVLSFGILFLLNEIDTVFSGDKENSG